jgi:hypothetical protein
MATQPTLASLLGSKDERKQVSLDLGQQALTPQVSRAGQYTVFAQPTAQENTSTRLANALSGVSPVLKNYAALTYSQGQAEAAAILPGNAEEQLKKMEPGTWLNMARQRGLREGLIKKHFNHKLLPEFKAQASEYSENFEKYPTLEKAVEAFDAYRDERWEQYVGEMPEGIGGSLESKVLWSTITDNVRNGVIESYNRNIDKFTLTNIADEDDQVWNIGTLPTEDGIDWAGQITASHKRVNELGSKAGLPRQEITEKSRIQMISRADALQNKGKNQDALDLIKALRAHKVNGQNIYADSATDVSLSRIEKRANDAIASEAGRDARDVAKEIEFLSDQLENAVLTANAGDSNPIENPRFADLVARFTNVPFADVKAEIEQHMATGALQGDSILKALQQANEKDSSDNQFATWTEVSNTARAVIDRHYTMNERKTKLEIGQADSFFSNYQTALEQGITSKGIVSYAEERSKQLSPEQLKRGQDIYDYSVNYLGLKANDKEVNDLFMARVKSEAESGRSDTAKSYVQNILVNELDPLYKEQGQLQRIPADERTAEQEERLRALPNEIATIRTEAQQGYKAYETELKLFETSDDVRPRSVTEVDIKDVSTIKDKAGKRVKLETLSPLKTRTYRSPGMAGIGRASESREWTPEEIAAERKIMLDAGAGEALELSIHTHPFELSMADSEDFSDKIKQLNISGVDATDKLIFANEDDAFAVIHGARLAVEDLERGKLDLSDPVNRALLTFAQDNAIKDEGDEDVLLVIVAQLLKSQNQ